MSAKKVILLGSTGSIGTSTLKVAQSQPDKIEIIGLAAGNNASLLAQQIHETGAKHACIFNQEKLTELKKLVPSDVKLYSGPHGLEELAAIQEAEIVLISIVGTAGLHPCLTAIKAGKDIAVASKEILVMAGEIVMQEAKNNSVKILPVDSEHNAIFQCLNKGRPSSEISKLILTASGGPFRNLPKDQLGSVTVQQALKHPTWSMGKKITIDSATLFNKGLEMIEARWLFDVEMQRIDAIIHPQSIIHSMVEYIDGSILAQLSTTDMCFPIQYALTYPDRFPSNLKSLDFTSLSKLEFETPRYDDFPALNLAKEAGTQGGAYPAVLNAANEVAVDAFLKESISFPSIWKTVEHTLSQSDHLEGRTLDQLIDADAVARKIAREYIA